MAKTLRKKNVKSVKKNARKNKSVTKNKKSIKNAPKIVYITRYRNAPPQYQAMPPQQYQQQPQYIEIQPQQRGVLGKFGDAAILGFGANIGARAGDEIIENVFE